MTPLGALGWVAAAAASIAIICMVVVLIAATIRTLDAGRKDKKNPNPTDGEIK